MKWISVKEKLPETGAPVLVAYKKTFPESCKLGKYRPGAKDSRGRYNEWTTPNFVHIKTPDYWAPIAPLPKAGE